MFVFEADTPEELRQEFIKHLRWLQRKEKVKPGDTKKNSSITLSRSNLIQSIILDVEGALIRKPQEQQNAKGNPEGASE